MHDTLKKPGQLLAVAYAVRFPELAAKSKHPGGELDLDMMDSQVCNPLEQVFPSEYRESETSYLTGR